MATKAKLVAEFYVLNEKLGSRKLAYRWTVPEYRNLDHARQLVKARAEQDKRNLRGVHFKVGPAGKVVGIVVNLEDGAA